MPLLKNYYKLNETLENDIKNLELKKSDILFISGQGIKLCKRALEQLRVLIANKKFISKQKEIEFFKSVKPQVVSKLIYYVKRLDIESKRPKAGKKEQVKYLKINIAKLQSFFSNNLEFYHYYKSCATHLDEQYFLIKNKTIRLNIEVFHFYMGKHFSTSHDSTVATIMGYTNLIEYLKLEINKLENTKMGMTTNDAYHMESKLHWTNSKTDLVELIYALYSSGAINSGTADIKDVAIAFQKTFNIDLGDYYHSFVEMRARKINPTKFMDKLKETLMQHMKDLDE